MPWSAAAIVGSAAIGYAASSNAADAASEAADKQAGSAAAQTALGREQLALAREQWEKGEARQAQYDPLYLQMMQSAIDDSNTSRERSTEQWDQYVSTFQPLEQKLAGTAAGYDTAGRRNQVAAEARQGVQTQFDAAQAQQKRGLSRAGIALDSGRALTLQQSSDFQEAKAMAGADRTARQQVEDRGIQLVDNAARFGRNQTGTALQASSLGTSQTGTASGIGATGAQVYNSALTNASALYGQAANTNASAGSMWGASAALNQNNAMQTYNAIAGIGQTAGQMYGRYGSGSSGIGQYGNTYTGAWSTGTGVGNAGAGDYSAWMRSGVQP